MKLTMSSEMGIHAVWFLAGCEEGVPVLSSRVAREIAVSESYLIKVLKRLVVARILISRKGKKGGYRVRTKPGEISLADIVEACEGTEEIYSCLNEERGCTEHSPNCPVRGALRKASRAMYDELKRVTIADLLTFSGSLPPATDQSG